MGHILSQYLVAPPLENIIFWMVLIRRFEFEGNEEPSRPKTDAGRLSNHVVWAPRIWHPCGSLFYFIEGTND